MEGPLSLIHIYLVDKGLVTNQLVLTVGYDIENLVSTQGAAAYTLSLIHICGEHLGICTEIEIGGAIP